MQNLSWNVVFLKGFDIWLNQYITKENDYYKTERDLCKALNECFIKASKENQLPTQEIKQEIRILGRTRVDFSLGRDVCFEVKFEPDYPEMLSTKKP